MPQIGKYFGSTAHFIVNPAAGPGVRLVSDDPTSAFETLNLIAPSGANLGPVDVWSHGLMTDYGRGPSDVLSPPADASAPQGFTSAIDFASIRVAYDHSRNRSPGATGEPVTFAPGQAGCIVKAKSRPFAHQRDALLDRRGLVYIVPTAPPANAIAPGVCSATMESRLTLADIDLTSNISATPASGAPTASNILQLVATPWENQNPRRPGGDRITGAAYEPQFRRDAAQVLTDAMLLSSCSIDPSIRNFLRSALVTQAEDTVQSLERGWRFNQPQTDGGVQNGRKPLVVFAACLTNDSLLNSWAARTDWATEDAYCQYITEDHLAAFGDGQPGVIDGFLPDDLGVPWWFAGRASWNTAVVKEYPCRTFWRRAYQEMFHRHMVGVHALAGLWPDFKAKWNNQAVWDYCDRLHYRSLYNGSGAVALGLSGSGTNNATTFHKNMFSAYAPPPVWNWPAA